MEMTSCCITHFEDDMKKEMQPCDTAGFQREVEKFFIFLLTLCLTTFSEAFLALFCSFLTPTFAVAYLVCAIISIVMTVSKTNRERKRKLNRADHQGNLLFKLRLPFQETKYMYIFLIIIMREG